MSSYVIQILPVFQMNTNIYYLTKVLLLESLQFFLRMTVVIGYFYVDDIVKNDTKAFVIDIGFLTLTHLHTCTHTHSQL